MRSKIWLFGLVVGIPIIAFAVAEGNQANFNSKLWSAISRNYPQENHEKISNFTIDLQSFLQYWATETGEYRSMEHSFQFAMPDQ